MMNSRTKKLKIKKIKSKFKKLKNLKEYKKNILCSKNFFMITKISIIFNSNIELTQLYSLEQKLSQNAFNLNTWSSMFSEASKFFDNIFQKIDWTSFGYFLFYVWNINLFTNKKTQKKSIYNYQNFNQINNKKTLYYNNWLLSFLKTKNKDFNKYIRKVLKTL